MLAAATTNGFLRFLVDTRRLDENPLMRLRRQYSAPRWEDFLAGLLGLHNASLVPAIPRPRFVSSLAPQLAAFVDLKRANDSTASSPAAVVRAPLSRIRHDRGRSLRSAAHPRVGGAAAKPKAARAGVIEREDIWADRSHLGGWVDGPRTRARGPYAAAGALS